MNGTLQRYTNYVNNDPSLTSEQKKEYLVHVAQIERAVQARIELAEKLIEYDKTREYYLNQLPASVTIENKDILQIINK